MIIESLIKGGAKLTLDCAKATVEEGKKIEIEDHFLSNPEIQNAIKLGYIKADKELKDIGVKDEEIKKIKFINKAQHRMAFECVRGGVDPESSIEIPSNIIFNNEIQNAISMGILVRCINKDEKVEEEINVPVAVNDNIELKNDSNSILCFECIKKTVLPGESIYIPKNKVEDTEISNAISYGLLNNVNEKNIQEVSNEELHKPVLLDEVEVSKEVSNEELHKPVLLDEVEVREEISNEELHKPALLDEVEVREEVVATKEPEIKTTNRNQKPEKKLSKTKTPKTISRISTEEDGTTSDDEVTEKNMYKESKLFIYQERKTISPEKTNEKLNKKQQDNKTGNDNNFDIFDIFDTK